MDLQLAVSLAVSFGLVFWRSALLHLLVITL